MAAELQQLQSAWHDGAGRAAEQVGAAWQQTTEQVGAAAGAVGVPGDAADCCEMATSRAEACLDAVLPCVELVGALASMVASPCVFPLVFCFPADGAESEGSSRAWAISMLNAPVRRPLECVGAMLCPCCAQYYVRLRALGGDISRYKLFQGRHDGPKCCALMSPSLPFTLHAGTHGDAENPQLFLCLEAWLCTYCAFHVSRQTMREERDLGLDPTEVRTNNCLIFFGSIARACCCVGCALRCAGCLAGLCAPEGSAAEGAAGYASRLGGGCLRVAHAIRRGMAHVRCIAVACMSAQMVHESYDLVPGKPAAEDRGPEPAWAMSRQGFGDADAGPGAWSHRAQPPPGPPAYGYGYGAEQASASPARVAGYDAHARNFDGQEARYDAHASGSASGISPRDVVVADGPQSPQHGDRRQLTV